MGNVKCQYGYSRSVGLDRPLGTDTLSLSSRPGLHYIGSNAQVRAKQRPHAKLFIHKEKHGAVCIHVPACLDPCENVSLNRVDVRRPSSTLIPIESSSRSVTRPNPGIFLIGSSLMNSWITPASNSSWNCPFGLFWKADYVSDHPPR